MRIHFPERLGLPQASAASHDHNGIKKVSRLVLICSGLLVLASIVLVATALQVVQSIDRADLVAERQRAANAIDAAVAAFGPLTEDGAVLMGQVAGLRDARLVRGLQQDPSVQQVPLLAGQGPAGSYLAWTRTSLGEGIFRQFAPIRLPFAAGTMLIILLLMLRVRHLVGEIDSQRRLAHRQSRSDPLTGLANRLALDGRLEQLVGEGTRFATLALDLDRFKHVNDAHGHAAGDEVLRSVARRLSRQIAPGDLLVRLGGDEFVLISTSRTGTTALARLAEDCIAAIERPVPLVGQVVSVGVSIGIVSAGVWYQTPLSLMGMADAALYRAKAQPGSAYIFAGHDSEVAPLPRPLSAAS